jgi:hypothetical protein
VPRSEQLSPSLEKRYQEDLLATLRRIDLLEDEKKETRKLLSACIDEEWSRVRVLRDMLEHRISPQTPLPGIGEHVVRKQQIGAVLRRAVDSAERICGAEVSDAGE